MKKIATIDLALFKSELIRRSPIDPSIYQLEKILSFISSPLNKILEESSIESIDEMIEHLVELDDTGSDEHELRQTKSKLQHIMTVSESVNQSFAGVF